MIDYAAVGNVISVCRREKGLTQDEFASKLGVTAQAVSKWERGASLPDTGILPDIASILEVSIGEMLAGTLPSKYSTSSDAGKTPVTESVFTYLLPDEVEISIPINLCIDNKPFLDGLLTEIGNLRKQLAANYGICLSPVRIRDNFQLPDNEYRILFRNKCYGSGYVHKGLKFTVSDDDSLPGIPAADHNGAQVLWMSEDEQRDSGDLPYFNAERFIFSHLLMLILQNTDVIVSRQMVKVIVDNLSEKHPVLVSEMIPARISYRRLREILIGILKVNRPIKDMVTILETTDTLLDENSGNDEIIKALINQIEPVA